jgi:hypothetical protein
MAIADSNRGRLAFIAESTFGTTPATPTMQILRVTQTDFGAKKDTTVSNEIRADRMVAGMMEVGATAAGTFDFELSLGGSFDALIEAAVCGTFSTAVTGSPAVTAGNVFTLTGIGANAVVGQYLYAQGFTNAANNGWHLVTAVTANAITVATTLTVESAGTATVKGKRVRNGTTARSFVLEEGFTDIGQFFLYNGQRVGSFSMDGSAGQIVTGKIGFQGTKGTFNSTTAANTLTAATTVLPVNATTNFGKIQEGASLADLATGVQGFNMSLDNTLRNQMAAGSKFPYGIGYGRQQITGTLNAYFENTNLYTKFLNHTATGLAFSFVDTAGNGMRVTLPRVYFSSSNPNVSGVDQDVMEQLQWTAISDATGLYQIQVDIA